MDQVGEVELMDKLFENAMKGNWDEVVKEYESSERAWDAPITWSGETALHLAISDKKTEVALRLVSIVGPQQLGITNNDGNTPLHFAAVLGDLELCEKIVSRNGEGVKARNGKGESPLFLAALNGKKEAFELLHSFSQSEALLKRNDGDTILHVAINGDYFSKSTKH